MCSGSISRSLQGSANVSSAGSFSAYYTRGRGAVFKENNGYCARHKKLMEKDDSCDRWHYRHVPKEKRTGLAVNAITEIYGKLAVIEQMLQEDKTSD